MIHDDRGFKHDFVGIVFKKHDNSTELSLFTKYFGSSVDSIN